MKTRRPVAAARMRLELLNVLARAATSGIHTKDAIAVLLETAAGVTVHAALVGPTEVRSGFVRAADDVITRELERALAEAGETTVAELPMGSVRG